MAGAGRGYWDKARAGAGVVDKGAGSTAMRAETTRARIVEAADDLFYHQGFEQTSFADIAAAVKLSRGNFYYHFKTKDQILGAVIERRLAKTRALLDQWEAEGALPEQRIRSFVGILIANRADIMLYGCPVGTLCAELAKLDHGAKRDASGIFTLFRDWLRAQFEALGLAAEADALAQSQPESDGAAAVQERYGEDVAVRAFDDDPARLTEIDAVVAYLQSLGTLTDAAHARLAEGAQ